MSGGEDATSFLSGLVTCAVEEGRAHYGAILTPQGKIIADFFLLPRGEGGVFLDAPKLVAETLFKRLTLYKLRAKVTLADVSAERSVFAAFGTSSAPLAGFASFADPRYAELGSLRLVASKSGTGAPLRRCARRLRQIPHLACHPSRRARFRLW